VMNWLRPENDESYLFW